MKAAQRQKLIRAVRVAHEESARASVYGESAGRRLRAVRPETGSRAEAERGASERADAGKEEKGTCQGEPQKAAAISITAQVRTKLRLINYAI